MPYACIDVGSNTTRLLVAEPAGRGLRELVSDRSFTLIGQAFAGGDTIPADKIAETAAVVAGQAERARRAGAEGIRVVATAAIRRARNRDDLMAAVLAASGLVLEVLEGEREAHFAWRGAASALDSPPAGMLAVLDVGGGSTEVAIGSGGQVHSVQSFPIGSASLAEACLEADPPTQDDLARAREEAARAFESFEPEAAEMAVAVGGSATSLRWLAGAELDRSTLEMAMETLAATPSTEIATRFELDPRRVRLLPAGLIVLDELARRLGAPLRICKGGLREGVILEMIENPI